VGQVCVSNTSSTQDHLIPTSQHPRCTSFSQCGFYFEELLTFFIPIVLPDISHEISNMRFKIRVWYSNARDRSLVLAAAAAAAAAAERALLQCCSCIYLLQTAAT
jgi:hypothetical protein